MKAKALQRKKILSLFCELDVSNLMGVKTQLRKHESYLRPTALNQQPIRSSVFPNKLVQFLPHLILASLVCLLSVLVLTYNTRVTQFNGNNYIPYPVFLFGVIIILMCLGMRLQFSKGHAITKRMNELFYYFLVILVVMFATNAIQYTPFKPIDQTLVKIDRWFGIDLNQITRAMSHLKAIQKCFAFVYDTLPCQMTLIPILMMILGRHEVLHKFYLLLFVSTLTGFTIYYFFPTVGPATALSTPYFIESQKATGLKFFQIHHHLIPTTLQGGMIAFPSFHVIWAWFCVYLTRNIPLIFYTLLLANVPLVLSCVLLGWHYAVDIVGSIILILVSHFIVNRLVKNKGKLTRQDKQESLQHAQQSV